MYCKLLAFSGECEPRHDKTNKMCLCPAKAQISLGIFTVRMKKPWVLSYPLSAQRRLWSDWVDAQADQSLRWAHTYFVGFVMSWFMCFISTPSINYCLFLLSYGGARWLSGRVSDSGARGPGFETYRRRVVSLSKTLYSPKVLVNYLGSDGSVPTWLKNCWLGR